MRVINTRTRIRETVLFWQEQNPVIPAQAALRELALLLDPDTATIEEVQDLFAKTGARTPWKPHIRCDQCLQEVPFVVEVGEEPDYDSSTARLCQKCLEAALALAKEEAQK